MSDRADTLLVRRCIHIEAEAWIEVGLLGVSGTQHIFKGDSQEQDNAKTNAVVTLLLGVLKTRIVLFFANSHD